MKAPKDIKKDVDALIDFLKEVQTDAFDLRKMMMKFKKNQGVSQEKIMDQLIIFDDVLKRYEWFEEDVDINGERMKKIAAYLKVMAKKKKLKEWLDRIKDEEQWNFDW